MCPKHLISGNQFTASLFLGSETLDFPLKMSNLVIFGSITTPKMAPAPQVGTMKIVK